MWKNYKPASDKPIYPIYQRRICMPNPENTGLSREKREELAALAAGKIAAA
jgi:hypothetical protein